MSYQVLYNRFRPKTFDEVVGQDSIVRILKNQIITGNTSHAYIFSGPRGTGKTSTAKIFAKAVNCEHPVNGESCGKCRPCLAASGNDLSDIIDLDAASQRGIDNIRDIIDKINYLPVNGKYRVYIIDEVHMLTPESFNALLKTIEEPPEHVIFIFATTEIQNVLPTILSRCQRFDFQRIPDTVIKKQLEDIIPTLGYTWDDGTLDLIASSAEGGMRDAWSITDKVLSIASDDHITMSDVENSLGLNGEDDIVRLASAILSRNASLSLKVLNELIEAGGDIEFLITSLGEYFRCLMVYSAAGDSGIIVKSERYMTSLKELSANCDARTLSSFVEELARLRSEMRRNVNIRAIFEAAIVRLCYLDQYQDTGDLAYRIEKLERRLSALIKGGVVMQPVVSQSAPAVENCTVSSVVKSSEDTSDIPDIVPKKQADFEDVKKNESSEGTPYRDPTGKPALKELQDLINFAANYVNNSQHDQLMMGFFQDMKGSYYDGNLAKIYPTGGTAYMMELFEKKGALKLLRELFKKRAERDIQIVITDPPKDDGDDGYLDSLVAAFGNVQEITDIDI